VSSYIDLENKIPNPSGAFPQDFYGLVDYLYLSEGLDENSRITFRNVAADVGLLDEGRGLGALFTDLDNDGDLDIVTARIVGGLDRPVSVLINDGDGRFTEQSSVFVPDTVKGIGIDVEVLDLNHDGRLDIYVGTHMPTDFVLLG